MRSRLLPFAGVILLSTSIRAQQPAALTSGQNQLPADVEATLSATAKRDVSARSGTPGEAGLARTGVEAILNASSTSSNVRARLGFEAAQRWFVDGVLTAPIGSDNDLTRTAGVGASAGSLADDAQFSIGFGRVDWSYRTDVDAAAKICSDVAQKGLGPCNTVNPKLPEDLRQALRSTFSIGTAYTYGARLSVGRSRFQFREAPGDATRTERHYVPLAVTGGVGALLRSNWFIAFQGGAERVRIGHSPQTLCSPLDDTGGTLRCENVALGEPVKDTGLVLVVEARRLFSRAAFAPRFEYRQTKDLRLFEAPVYFLSDPDQGGWTGGVMLRVKNSDTSVAVFVGPVLPYFGLK
jgi:hypothetical protein